MRWGGIATACFHAAAAAMVVPAAGSDMRVLIEQALDEPAKIELNDIKLGDAIGEITEQTGVKIVMPPEALALVPYGPETPVHKVQIADMSLRKGLTTLFAPLGMTFIVMEDHLRIIPKEALLCLGRPPTWAELDALAELSAQAPGVDEEALASLQARLQFRVIAPDPWAMLSQALRRTGAGPGDEVLTIACANLGWGWCLSDTRIVVGSLVQQIRRQLRRPISLRRNSRSLFDMLTEIGRVVNVPIRQEPGTLASLPLQVQKNYSLTVDHASAEMVLDRIAADTGLGYLIEPDGVLFYRPSEGGPQMGSRNAKAAPSTSDPYVAKIVNPPENGKSIEWLIRRSELPPDLREMRERDLAEYFEAARQRNTPARP